MLPVHGPHCYLCIGRTAEPDQWLHVHMFPEAFQMLLSFLSEAYKMNRTIHYALSTYIHKKKTTMHQNTLQNNYFKVQKLAISEFQSRMYDKMIVYWES